MKVTPKELEMIVCNSELNDYMRERIGYALCKKIYDSANSPEDYLGEYSVLYDGSFYNKPSDDDIFLCIEYMIEVIGIEELEINVLL